MRAADFRERAEHRWPVVVAIATAMALHLLLPGTFIPWLRYAIAAICAITLVPLVLYNPSRLTRQTRLSRIASISLAVVLLVANQVALVQLVVELVTSGREDGIPLLLAAAQVWVTNVIAYGVIYWEMDRGGPVVRRRDAHEQLPPADFRFPQDEDADASPEVAARSRTRSDWSPAFFDYL